jgi:hypothetical protein
MTSASTMSSWDAVGALAPASLADARRQLHHAAQIANAAAMSLLPSQPDDSHTNFEWLAAPRALASNVVPASPAFRVGLRVADCTLLWLSADGAVRAQMPLDGATMAGGFAWVVERTRDAGADDARLTLRKHYEIPSHAVAHGARFALGDGGAFRELDRYWSDADAMLRDVAARERGASPVRCWPHHFDVATLIATGASSSMNVGMEPGDDSYAEPYFYVSPYPYPSSDALSPLPVGHWHTEGWTGAVLPSSELVREPDPIAQRALVARFIDAAIAACRAGASR